MLEPPNFPKARANGKQWLGTIYSSPPHDAAGIVVDPLLRKAFVTNYATGTLSVIDVDAFAVVATIPVGQDPRQIRSDAVLGRVIDQHMRSVTTIAVGKNPSFARVAERVGRVYVNNIADKTVSVIDSSIDTDAKWCSPARRR